jgi:hypothetical protein
MQPQYRQVNVKPGELVDIDYIYDMGLADLFQFPTQEKYAKQKRLPYYAGGSVPPPATLEELLMLLGGRNV